LVVISDKPTQRSFQSRKILFRKKRNDLIKSLQSGSARRWTMKVGRSVRTRIFIVSRRTLLGTFGSQAGFYQRQAHITDRARLSAGELLHCMLRR
jgi:hypothetical protein